MLYRTVLALAAFLALSCLTASAAIASTKCQCNDGSIVQSMEDDGDNSDCNDACEEFGGGRVWTLEDEATEGDSDEVVGRRVIRSGASAAERGAGYEHQERIP